MLAILSAGAPERMAALLRENGYETIRLPENPNLPAPTAAHPDLSVFFATDAILTTPSYAKRAAEPLMQISQATRLPVRITRRETGNRYPQDILLDALPIGNRLFCLPDATANELTAHPAYRVIPVRQGYAKCAALPVGDHALASVDPAILAAARQEGLDILPLSPGGIRLEGYDTGFLGGAASFAPYGGTETVFFCGDLAAYPDGDRLKAFLASHGMTCRDLPGLPLCDIGTIFLLNGGIQHGTA